MPRNKQFDEQKALDAAMRTFWEKGYEGTSLQDLESATGLARTSIYNAYGNKRKLFEKAIIRYRNTVLHDLVAKLNNASTAREGIRALMQGIVDMHYDSRTPGGCLVVLSILESEQHDDSSSALVEEMIGQMKKAIHKRLLDARRNGDLPADLDVNGVSSSITAAVAGMMVMGKAGFPRSTLQGVIRTTLNLLES